VIDNYRGAMAYLESLMERDRDKDKHAGLARMWALLNAMGNPQEAYSTVHIGGTAGKGSTAMILAAILKNSGYKTGLHVSPHLEDARERMQVNGKFIPVEMFVELVNYIMPFIEKVHDELGYGWPSYFEALIALTFECFKREKVDVAVIEVGMGGEYDGTNVISPLVTVLTNVGLDHTEYLGNTVEKIAREKVGIFKQGIDVMSGVSKPSVVRIAKAKAKKSICRLYLLDREIKWKLVKYGNSTMIFDFQFDREALKHLALSASGEYQIRNASLSVAAALSLRKHNFKISESSIRRALGNIHLPGRFEIVGRKPTVILDGAHNPMKMEALVSTLVHNYKNKKIKVVFASKKGKNVGEMLSTIGKVADTFYFTKFQATTDFGKNMSHDPSELQRHTKVRSLLFDNASEAYRKALEEAGKTDTICVTGSLYLVGELRSQINRRRDAIF